MVSQLSNSTPHVSLPVVHDLVSDQFDNGAARPTDVWAFTSTLRDHVLTDRLRKTGARKMLAKVAVDCPIPGVAEIMSGVRRVGENETAATLTENNAATA